MVVKEATNVTIKKFGPTSKMNYSDGPDEEVLLNIVSTKNVEESIADTLRSEPSWPIYYHLHPSRENILNWYPFKKGARILEVGAGCGAVTGSLLHDERHVTAVELSLRRAQICARRHSEARSLEICVGDIQHFEPTEKYDYVVCVGVLEYAEKYIGGDSPAQSFLELLRSFLKKGGVLLLAIENQLGLKYFSGAREDHTGQRFSGINDYRQAQGIRTYGRQELRKLISESGFDDPYYYYPFPDYKFPFLIYSDDYYPGLNNVTLPKNFFPTPTPDHRREPIFSESGLMSVLERNDLFRDLSNSFLLEARRDG